MGMTDRELILKEIDKELDRMDFEESFRQRWGKLTIEFVYENGTLKATITERETTQLIKK
jgi:hypothetical protein